MGKIHSVLHNIKWFFIYAFSKKARFARKFSKLKTFFDRIQEDMLKAEAEKKQRLLDRIERYIKPTPNETEEILGLLHTLHEAKDRLLAKFQLKRYLVNTYDIKEDAEFAIAIEGFNYEGYMQIGVFKPSTETPQDETEKRILKRALPRSSHSNIIQIQTGSTCFGLLAVYPPSARSPFSFMGITIK